MVESSSRSGRSMLNVKAESPAGGLLRAQSGERASALMSPGQLGTGVKKSSELT